MAAAAPGRINKFSADGATLLTIATPFTAAGVAVRADGTIYVANYGDGPNRGIYRYSADGTPLGLFASPLGISGDFIAFDSRSNLYAPNFATGAIIRISPTGADLGRFATLGGVEGIAFDTSGNLYAASYNGNVIERFSPSGMDLGVFASIGMNQPYGLAFDGSGNLFVANLAGRHVREVSRTGEDLGIFASAGLVSARDLLVFAPPVAPVPEPSMLLLFCSGFTILGSVLWKRRRRT